MSITDTIHERISILVDTFGDGKNTVLAELLGCSEANIRGYRAKIEPKYTFIENIARTLEISTDWLIMGQGEMLKSDTPQVREKEVVVYQSNPRDAETMELQRYKIKSLEDQINNLKIERLGVSENASTAHSCGDSREPRKV